MSSVVPAAVQEPASSKINAAFFIGGHTAKDREYGTSVLQLTSAGKLLMLGAGASEQGERPFLDQMDPATGKSERIWRSDGPRFTYVHSVLDDDGKRLLLSHESPSVPPQLYVHTFSGVLYLPAGFRPKKVIHGMADSNSGTFPIQSERLFEAMEGLGGKARYVQLPAESHGYMARESILHMLWEQVRSLDRYVRPKRKIATP